MLSTSMLSSSYPVIWRDLSQLLRYVGFISREGSEKNSKLSVPVSSLNFLTFFITYLEVLTFMNSNFWWTLPLTSSFLVLISSIFFLICSSSNLIPKSPYFWLKGTHGFIVSLCLEIHGSRIIPLSSIDYWWSVYIIKDILFKNKDERGKHKTWAQSQSLDSINLPNNDEIWLSGSYVFTSAVDSKLNWKTSQWLLPTHPQTRKPHWMAHPHHQPSILTVNA